MRYIAAEDVAKAKPTPLGAKFGTVIISRSMRLSYVLSENMVIYVLLVK